MMYSFVYGFFYKQNYVVYEKIIVPLQYQNKQTILLTIKIIYYGCKTTTRAN